MAKGDKVYFENFVACTALSKEAAAYLAANRDKALAYGVDPHKIGRLGRSDDSEDE